MFHIHLHQMLLHNIHLSRFLYVAHFYRQMTSYLTSVILINEDSEIGLRQWFQ